MKKDHSSSMQYEVCVIGGCGHIGAPLGILFASKGLKVVGYDINQNSVNQMNAGKMWFIEPDCDKLLQQNLDNRNISFSADPKVIKLSKFIIICVGTSVDEHANPKFAIIDELIGFLKKQVSFQNQVIILRSTVYPGTT